jgi:ABC-type Mn2+/Zn2+ transport system ATPase subunit
LIKFSQLEHSLILLHNDQIVFTSDEHWLYPLFELEQFISNSVIPVNQLFLKDKIAGKAAAALIVRLGIRNCFIELLSERAVPVLEQYGVKYAYNQMVDHIQCRTEDLITDKMSMEDTYLFLRKRAGRVQGTTLKINDLTVEISGKSILKDLNLELGRGEQLVIQGENGGGKTTLLKSILGLINPVQGSILIGEELVGSSSWQKNRYQTGYLNQETTRNNFPITAAEVVAIGVSGIKISKSERDYRVELAMRKTGCFSIRNEMFHQLSGGEKQRVSLARCLCQNARLLLLDEPTSYLDEKGKEELSELLIDLSRNEAPTMLLVSHDSNWTDQLNWHNKTLKNGKLC